MRVYTGYLYRVLGLEVPSRGPSHCPLSNEAAKLGSPRLYETML